MKWTAELASFVAGQYFEDLPPEVVKQAKLLMLDTLGCALGGVYPCPKGGFLDISIGEEPRG